MPFGIGGSFGKSKSKAKSDTSTGVAKFLRSHFQDAAGGAADLFNRGPQVFEGQRVADFAPETEEAFGLTRKRALAGQGSLDTALRGLTETAEGRGYLPPEIQDLLQSAGSTAAQGTFAPIAQRFQGSGGFGSPLANAAIARAGTEASQRVIAPILSDLFTQQANRRESALRDLPGLYQQTATAPGDILRNIGAQREGREQAILQGQQDEFTEREDARRTGVEDYINSLLGIGQLFRRTKTRGKSKNKSLGIGGKAEGSELSFLGAG